MTGSIPQFLRQHSSTATAVEKRYRPKLRRCSSADDHSPIESIPMVNQPQKEIFSFKPATPTSDIDSGTEEIEQVFFPVTSDQDEPIPQLDEGFSEYDQEENCQLAQIKHDLELAKRIPDELKKDFCPDTRVAFHGEFARNISIPLSLLNDTRYYLLAEDEVDPEYYASIPFDCRKVDNAKAQFKCSNIYCQHAWTSMRARILFSITHPSIGIIALKILGQNCQYCGANADALWYIDEVCRVMKNLAQSLFERFFPVMLEQVDLTVARPIEENIKPSRHPNHDLSQRRGKMHAQHNRHLCQACQLGLCFA